MSFWQSLFDRHNRPAWIVLLVCLALTIVTWYGLRSQSIKSTTRQFELHVLDVTDSIEARLREHEQILLGGAALFDASAFVSRAEWHTYVERLNLRKNYPGILGVGYSEIVQPAGLQAHIAAIRSEGFPEYTVRPPGERPVYSSIIYLEPFSGRNLAAFGYDMLSETTRSKAMHIAAEGGKASISGKVKLVQETHGKEQAGFLMYVPVYRKHQLMATPEERWKALQGFVYSPYRVDDLMEGILGNRVSKLDFAIFDGGEETGEARMFLSIGEQAFKARAASAKLSAARNIHAYGHMWTVRFYSHPDLEDDFHSPINTAVLGLGTGISLLLFALMASLISRRRQAEVLAEKMTRQIRENEKRLTEINQRFDLAAGSANIGVWDYDLASGKLVWDERMRQLYEVGSGEFEGTYAAWSNHLHPDDRERCQAELRAALGGAGSLDTTFRIVWKNGEIHHIKSYAQIVPGEDGLPRQVVGINYDITGRRQIEEELAKRVHDLGERIKEQRCLYQMASLSRETALPAEEFFMRAVNLLPPAWQYPEHTCARITCKGREYSSGNYIASNWRMTAPIMAEGEEQGRVEVCYLKEMPPEHEGPFLREERELIEAFASQIGQTIGIRKAEEELRKLSRAVEQSPVSVMITDASGDIEYINAKFSEVTGYTSQEVMGKNPRIIQSGRTPEEVYRLLWQALKSGQQWRGKLQNRKKNGEFFWEDIYISAIRDGEGKITNYVAVKEDITERMNVERMKSEFISTVSHELRTPLTSIRGSLALVVAGVTGELPAAAKPMIEIAHKNSERLILLVNDILDMEKIEAGRMEFSFAPARIMPLIEQSLESNRAYAGQFGVTYELEGSLPEAEVRVDANRLLQVFANLLSNAAKFSHEGGKVKVAVERIGRTIRVSVKDNGIGIPEEFKSRIFHKFSQADSSDTRKKGGTGLGLVISKAIVEQMGGAVDFESQPDVQTTFFVEFPEWKNK